MHNLRFDRNERLFGKDGQSLLRAATVAVIGVGGLGTHLVQQLALLGVGGLILVDPEELDQTNCNRYIGVRADDAIPGTPKVEVGYRLAKSIDPELSVERIQRPLRSQDAFSGIRRATHVFGSLDLDGERLVLNELCSAFSQPYVDLASDVVTEPALQYGGRTCVNWSGDGCLTCMKIVDPIAAGRDLGDDARQRNDEAIYGVRRTALGDAGPSVVSINGVIASIGVTEFMVGVTGLRAPRRLITYYGTSSKVVVSTDPPEDNCYYCKSVRGAGDKSDVARYFKGR